MSIFVDLSVHAGVSIEEAAEYATSYANRLGVQVKMPFNGLDFYIYPQYTSKEDIVDSYLSQTSGRTTQGRFEAAVERVSS